MSNAGTVDFTIMYFTHEALRRDLALLAEALRAGRALDPAVRNRWDTFKRQLHGHHSSEDAAVWPPLRDRLVEPADIAVIDAMEAEHAHIDPLLLDIDTALSDNDGALAAPAIDSLATLLDQHLAHEERDALPLIDRHLGPEGWAEVGAYARKHSGRKGVLEFFPWLLDGVAPERHHEALSHLPLIARVAYHLLMKPLYDRTPRWSAVSA